MELRAGTTLVTASDLVSIPNQSPQFRDWAWYQLNFAPEHLDDIVSALLQKDKGTNVREALEYLNDFLGGHPATGERLNASDITGENTQSALFKKLRVLLGKDSGATNPDVYRFLGQVGHKFMPLFLGSQRFPRTEYKFGGPLAQRSLFQKLVDEEDGQKILFPFLADQQFAKSEIKDPNRSQLRQSYALWKRIAENVKDHSLTELYSKHGPKLDRLTRMLKREFAPYSSELEAQRDAKSELVTLSLMSWVSAVELKERQPRIFFTEIPVLDRHHRLGAWRIDAAEVRTIEGKAPTPKQRAKLRELSLTRFTSVGHLLQSLISFFGEELELGIWDWKFAIGDGAPKRVIDPRTMVQDVLAEHTRQIQRYLMLGSLDCHLTGRPRAKTLWHDDYFLRGTLAYFFPTHRPILEQIVMTPELHKQIFEEEVLMRFGSAKQRAKLRELTSQVVGNVFALWNGNGKPKNGSAHKPTPQVSLFEEPSDKPRSALHYVEQMQKPIFLEGSHGLLEVVGLGEGGRKRYELRLDTMLKRIEEGVISGRNIGQGWLISCPHPDHDDSTPSCAVYLTGHFHCFGCKNSGKIAAGSIPKNIELVPDLRQQHERMRQGTTNALVPERHREVMRTVQAHLSAKFRNSPAERYLAHERRLDPELAASFGAGYGSNELILDLLQDGVSYEELIHYGLVGISPKMKPSSLLIRSLLQKGYSLESLGRELKVPGGKNVSGLPYPSLSNRITFPLMTESWVTSVYGRAIYACDKQFSHRKLTIKYTGVPHGAFNVAALNAPGNDLIVTEGVMDALSLIEAGVPNTLALIGVQNTVILEALERSRKKLWIALDIDENKSGQNATAKIIERFRSRGVPVGDFTAKFAARLTEQYKDYNAWWQASGRHLSLNDRAALLALSEA
ncbi:MAG: hypothetical protein LiPW15_268 [Parcubacteria group bacterium LiPW_15]|nr:MAG: hypothetical protein LiPW15_268 [Parcubacteria group bacterium LiPW_15]